MLPVYHFTKNHKVMKKSLLKLLIMSSRLMLIAFFVQLSTYNLLFAYNANAQMNTVIHKELDSKSLRQVFKIIEKETSLRFVYDTRKINIDQSISISGQENTVKDILNKVGSDLHLAFKIINNTVTVIQEQEAISTVRDYALPLQEDQFQISLSLRQLLLSGTVMDAGTNEPLPGVSVTIKGTKTGTSTDKDGRYSFSIANISDDAVLLFSYIGYKNLEIPVNGRSKIDAKLESDTKSLEEVVVVGYGTQKKVNITGAVSSVKVEELNSIASSNLSNTLAGRAPGVNVTNTSGLSGAASKIRIRGSFSEPLYVIDGIVRDKAAFDALEASEVDQMSFLKDAATASIYGSRAGSGVVLITTKKGSVQNRQLRSSQTIRWPRLQCPFFPI